MCGSSQDKPETQEVVPADDSEHVNAFKKMMLSDDELCLNSASREKTYWHTPLHEARSDDILRRGEGQDDLPNRDRDRRDKPSKSSKNKCQVGCPVTNFLAVYTLREIKPRTRQEQHVKACDNFYRLSSRGRI